MTDPATAPRRDQSAPPGFHERTRHCRDIDAETRGLLVFARAVQGLGGAVVTAVALALIMNLFTEANERARAMGIYAFVCAVGGTIGEVLGGVITEWISWRWTFLINVPIGVAANVCGVAVNLLVATPVYKGTTVPNLDFSLDWPDPTVEYCFRSSSPFVWLPQSFKTVEQQVQGLSTVEEALTEGFVAFLREARFVHAAGHGGDDDPAGHDLRALPLGRREKHQPADHRGPVETAH